MLGVEPGVVAHPDGAEGRFDGSLAARARFRDAHVVGDVQARAHQGRDAQRTEHQHHQHDTGQRAAAAVISRHSCSVLEGIRTRGPESSATWRLAPAGSRGVRRIVREYAELCIWGTSRQNVPNNANVYISFILLQLCSFACLKSWRPCGGCSNRPAARGIVKKQGDSRQNTLRRVRGSFPDTRVARRFPGSGAADCD
jgi:hypothetical protein